MIKDFDLWNNQKKGIHANPARPLFNERDIWWCSFGLNVGDEQDGKGSNFTRPVLVIRKFNQNIFWGLALSTQIKSNQFYHRIQFQGAEQSVILSQLRLIDAKRLGKKMGALPEADFNLIRQKLKNFLT